MKESKNTLFNFVSYSIPENLEQSKGEAIATIKSFDCLTRNLFTSRKMKNSSMNQDNNRDVYN